MTGDIKAICENFKVESDSARGSVVNSVAANNAGLNLHSLDCLQTLVKLPPIKLPSFNGQYSSWLEFKDAFMAMVHNSQGLNDIQKFYYLRASLDRDVLEIIKSIEVSASNYTTAWQFLIDRFENKNLIIHNHIRAIFEHPNIIKESYVDLRNLFDSITKHLRSLKTLGEQTDSWD